MAPFHGPHRANAARSIPTAGTERVQREMVEAVGIEPTSATPKNHEIRTPSGYPPAGVALSFQCSHSSDEHHDEVT